MKYPYSGDNYYIMRRRISILILFLLSFGFVVAQNDTAKIILMKPMLNGHSFINFNTTKSAFIKTYMNTEMGLGSTGEINLPGFMIDDTEILAFSGEVLFMNLYLEYQQKINDWLALYAKMYLGGRLGTSISTILVDGINSFKGGNIGWLFRVVNKQKFQMTGNLFVRNSEGNFINIIGYVNDIIDSVPNPEVVKYIPILNFGAGLQGAFAFNETFGLQFNADISYGESFKRGTSDIFSSFSLFGDMDLMPRHQIPMGFALGYGISSIPETTYMEFIYTNIYSAQIAYTGSSDFELGFQLIFNRVQINSLEDEKPMLTKAQFNLRFYF